jgi:hypothetical protein
MAQLVEEHQLGIVVDYQDVCGVAEAILGLLVAPTKVDNTRFELVRQALTWEKAARPLIAFCCQPRRAPDKVALGMGEKRLLSYAEIEHLQAKVDGYERGRFIRFTKWLHRIRQRLTAGR